MNRQPPGLAKLTRPRIFGAMARERLFALLDRGLERPCVWVSGPPGAGKTTLAASYLEARRVPGIWYQIDSGDSDPASFFHYLRLAASRYSRGKRRPLPLLTSEHLPDLIGFTRRYVRDLCGRLPAGSILVLDNYQEAAPASPLHQVVSTAVEELPAEVGLIVLSRIAPPPEFARLLAGDRVALLEWDALRLTVAETRFIAQAKAAVDEHAAAMLHRQCAGWAGGLTLMLEQIRRIGTLEALERVESLDIIFDYFAQQVFASAPAPTRNFLLRTAALPRMTAATAQEISGQTEAPRMLEDLYRRGLFTDRRLGEQPTYQYHALFRGFLGARAIELLGAGEWERLSRHAGQMLEAQGLPEDAAEAYRSIRDWDSVVRIIRTCAQTLLAQGRWQTLRDWIDALPPALEETDAWLPFWYGSALLATDATAGREALEQAYRLFAVGGDVEGQLRCTSGIIEARFLETVDHRALDPWLLAHERLLGLAEGACTAELRLRAHSAMVIGTLYRQPGNPALKASVQQVLALLDSDIGTNEKLAAAGFLLVYTGYTGDFDTAALVIPVGAALAERPEATALNRGTWFNWLGYNALYSFDTAGACRALGTASDIAKEEHLQSVAFIAAYFQGMLQRSLRRYDRAEKHLEHLQTIGNGRSLIQRAIRHALTGWLAVRSDGNPAQAIQHGRAAWTISRQLGSPSYLVHWGTPLIYGLIERRQFEEGLALLQEQREALAGTAIRCYDPLFWCVDATVALRHGEEDRASELASRMFAMARAAGHGAYLTRLAPWMPRLCQLALERGLEAEYVAGLVRQAGWPPPSQAVIAWPWRWKVFALGRFELLRDGQPLEFGRKVPRRPLALLRALIAAGPGGAPAHSLSDHLWPDHEADRAHHALAAAVHRLRRLLGDGDLLQLKDNHVSLDATRLWVDAWAFEELAQSAGQTRQPPVSSGDLGCAVSLYRGKFLPGDEDAVWALSARERLRGKFVSCIRALGRHYESAGDPARAIDCYRRGIEADDLTEAFYQGLMRCYGALGMPAEGIVAYHHMRESLFMIRQTLPSQESEALYRRLSAGREHP